MLPDCRLNRRTLLKTAAFAGAAAFLPRSVRAQSKAAEEIISYLEKHARPGGGYGWEDQERAHLTPTYAVIGCYKALKREVPRAREVAAWVRENHPARLKKLEQERRVFEFQQVQALAWLGEKMPQLSEKIRAWRKPLAYMKAYERHGWPVFSSEVTVFLCRKLLDLPLDELAPDFIAYLDSRRRPNGSFASTPAEDGGDGHVMNTWWGLRALDVLRRSQEKKDETIAWLRACQLPNGGFTYAPHPVIGGVDDVGYTWAAVRGLSLLGAKPTNVDGCMQWLGSLRNSDGGFADRPGWLSNPLATFHTLEALDALGALLPLATPALRSTKPRERLSEDLRVFTIQIEAHGQGSPADAVEIARLLRIHLWGAKNAKPEWLARAQALADAAGVPVKFFASNEEYGTWVNIPGMGTYSHTSDIIAPAGAEIGTSLAETGAVSWPEFRERRLVPLERGGGRLVWQFGENEELVRMLLDDSLQRGGFAAISTFHFGNPDFTNSEPFLQRWRGQIPYVALQDAHGPEPWWFCDMTAGFRTVFLAKEPTWEAWLEALKLHRVAAVRHDGASGLNTWMHASSREVLDFLRAREQEWRWWNNPEINRPMISLVAIKPHDPFEVGRPDVGVTLRVRCARENTTQGVAKAPLCSFKQLVVDGREVQPRLVEQRKGQNFADIYHEFHLANPPPGEHSATAIASVLATKQDVSRTIQFSF